MKRKIVLISAAVALAALMIAGGTLAWFTAADTAENTLTTGKVDVAINETMLSPTGGPEIAYTDPTGALVPGDTVSKIARVENTGSASAWIRAKAETSWPAGSGLDSSMITINYNTADWTLGTDGWYYYTGAVAVGAETTPLFSNYTLSTSMGNAYASTTATIKVYAEGVQSANNGAASTSAAGWPVPTP